MMFPLMSGDAARRLCGIGRRPWTGLRGRRFFFGMATSLAAERAATVVPDGSVPRDPWMMGTTGRRPGGPTAGGSAMTDGARTTPEETRTLLVLGASGDLAGRLLLPGLGRLLATGRSPDLRLVGSGVEDWDDEQWRARLREVFAVEPSIEMPPWERFTPLDEEPGAATLRRLERESVYRQADVTDPEDLRRVLLECEAPVGIYFALPPAVTERACLALEEIGVPAGTRLIIEKPFGTDEESARRLNDVVGRLVPEDHVHRVDHFLGKSTVLNILGFRFANRIFEPVWNAAHVDRVDIVYDE